jgi:hypothetical protein
MNYQDKLKDLSFNDFVNLSVLLEVSDAYPLTDNLKRIRIELLNKLAYKQ